MGMKKKISVLLFLFCLPCLLTVSASQNMVSLHKGYELVTNASTGYPDGGGELTNGKYGRPIPNGDTQVYYRDPEFVGFPHSAVNSDGNLVIVLDLGEETDGLYGFELHYLQELQYGICAPAKVAFYLSDSRSGNYTFVGERTLPEPRPSEQQKTGVASVTAEQGVRGRFVMCVITPRDTVTDTSGTETAASWTFLDELTVLQGQASPGTPPTASEGASPGSAGAAPPQTGDKSILLLCLLCGISGLTAVALMGRKTV